MAGTFEINEMQRLTTEFSPVSDDFLCAYSNIAQKQETKICTYDENNNERQNSLAFVAKKLYYKYIRAGNVSRK